jgi:hypothetical protein
LWGQRIELCLFNQSVPPSGFTAFLSSLSSGLDPSGYIRAVSI